MAHDKQLPDKVRHVFEEMKNNGKRKLSLVFIKGNYYVNEYTTHFSGKYGRTITVSRYIGKIDPDGTFTEAKHRKQETMVKNVKEFISNKESISIQDKLMHPDNTDTAMLEILSADGRITITKLAKRLSMSVAACKYRLKRLEQRYSIRYTVEFGPRPFGFFRYIALVKFSHEKPDIEEFKKVLEKEPLVQMVLPLSGSYHFLLYFLAENTQLLEDTIYRIRSAPTISRFKAYWNVTYISRAYGYVPMRQEFVDSLSEKVWHKSRESPRRNKDQLLEREYIVLKELNANGRINFSDLDAKYGLGAGASDYTYNRLVKNGIIERITINMMSIPMKYPMLFIAKQPDIEGFNAYRNEFRIKLITLPNTPTNKYAIMGDIGSPYGFLFIMPVYTSASEAEKELMDLSKQKIRDIEGLIITDIALGSIGFRRAPIEITNQYKYLQKLESQGKDV